MESTSSSSSSSTSSSEESSDDRSPKRAAGARHRPASSSSSESEDSESDLDGEEELDKEVEIGGLGLKDLIVKQEELVKDSSYKANWANAPPVGSCGFNRFAAEVLRRAGIGAARPGAWPLQPHQEAVACLVHPESPVSRLLVDHPTGSGKTREMIQVLDNYYLDPRPKVPIFPKEPVCRNFYLELLRWPSRYRDFFACLHPTAACGAEGQLWRLELPKGKLKELIELIREVLEMKGWFYMGRMRRSRLEAFRSKHPTVVPPAAPLRALRYTSAGGRHADLRPDGWPLSALLKVAFSRPRDGENPYSSKVVLMDEAHNLVRTQTQYGAQLTKLRGLLFRAQNTVLVGFTGTPMLNEAAEGRQLLDIIKGAAHAQSADEGFLSSFPMRPAGLFPSSLPRGVPDGILTPKLRRQCVRKVILLGEPLKRYDAKRQKGLKDRRLRAYCNLCVHFGSLHEGQNGSKARVLANMNACAPKLFAIAQDVARHSEKALVLVARSSGLLALLEHLRALGSNADKPFGVATMDELPEFNSTANLRGERFRVMVADATQCSEGVSFLAVRRLHLADVPASPSAFVQFVGRAIRMYGHQGLPVQEQTVTTTLWLAVLPRWMRSSLAAWSFRAQRRREAENMEIGARQLLRRLLAAGIPDLATLKARLDRLGRPKQPLTSPDVATFLEQLRMWEEAKALRQRGQRPALRRPRQARREVKKEPDERSKARPIATPQADERPLIALLQPPAAPDPRAGARDDDVVWDRDPLVRALQHLRAAESTQEAESRLQLSQWSADEEALKTLARCSRDFVPALADLRRRAVDREVLLMASEACAEEASEGESSGVDFGVSEKEEVARDRSGLPLGWRMEARRWKGREMRHYVDPRGRSYRTLAEARRAVAEARHQAQKLRGVEKLDVTEPKRRKIEL